MTDGDETPDRYRWDLSALFADGSEWERACEDYEDQLNRLSFDETAIENASALADALKRRAELLAAGSKLEVYATCRSWNDVTDEETRNRLRRIERLNSRRDAKVQELESALRVAGRDHVDELVETRPALTAYDHYLDDVFRRDAYSLDPSGEAILGDLDESLDAPARMLRTVSDRAFDPPTVTAPDGEEVRLTMSSRLDVLASPDRAYRRQVYETYRDALYENREMAAQGYVDHVRSHAARADVRNYESLLAASLDGLVPPAFVQTLVDSVREDGGPFRRRYEVLRDRRGIDELRPWDLRAPLSDETAHEIPYEEAVEVVVAAVETLGEAYQERLAEFLEDRRVDVYASEGKRDVPAAMFGTNGTDAFVHLTYERSLDSLYLFAHELGHVMHYLLAKDAQPPTYARLPWHVGELPSFLHEVLLTDYLLGSDRVADGAVLDTVLRRLPPLAPARGVAFTRRLVQDVEAGESPTADVIDAYWRETGRAFFAPVTFTDADGHRWLSLNLDRDPYHAVWYLVGRTGALAVAQRLTDGDLTLEQYRNFLRAGDSAYPMDLLERLGLGVESEAMVDTAASKYGRLLDAL